MALSALACACDACGSSALPLERRRCRGGAAGQSLPFPSRSRVSALKRTAAQLHRGLLRRRWIAAGVTRGVKRNGSSSGSGSSSPVELRVGRVLGGGRRQLRGNRRASQLLQLPVGQTSKPRRPRSAYSRNGAADICPTQSLSSEAAVGKLDCNAAQERSVQRSATRRKRRNGGGHIES